MGVLVYKIIVNGRRYRLRPAYDNVLKAVELYGAHGAAAIPAITRLLVRENPRGDMYAVALEALRVLIPEPDREPRERKRLFDLEQDFPAIYAGFLQAYGIDLYEERGKLHFTQFMLLLQNLPENTRFSQVVAIRAAKVPQMNKHNAEYVKRLLEQKNAVRLKLSEQEERAQRDAGFEKLFAAMVEMARR